MRIRTNLAALILMATGLLAAAGTASASGLSFDIRYGSGYNASDDNPSGDAGVSASDISAWLGSGN